MRPSILLLSSLLAAVVTAARVSQEQNYAYADRSADLLKRLAEPPRLSKRTPALMRRTRCEECALPVRYTATGMD
ncbi:hypothetical protein FN846DRAFT_926657 [Sphaerosporella brunnea]|uniref:Uncharacterized protein n=1 Tax=Sphaerosporella brunnea TaxID=1250544 RepID=A0A5J5FAL1_9PEZI|nr:hypothetical protein FN846DRAFT_926657 [Sphaerosporella brunnea]